MRGFLDRLYSAAGYAAAFFMVVTLLMVVAGIADRALALGWRGTDMYAGYAMAACGFLALAHTFKRGEHIRVSLLLQAASPRVKRLMEIWSLLAAGLLPALAGILDACISRLNALAAVLGKRMAVAPVGCSVFPAEKWRHWLIRWTSPSAAGMPWLPC